MARVRPQLIGQCGIPGIAFAFLLAGVQHGFAQAPDCSYDRCALRLNSTLFRTQLVRGRDAEPVARLGLFPPRVTLFEQANDSARNHYRSFRSAQAAGAGLGLAGFVGLTVGFFLVVDERRRVDAGAALAVGGLALTLGGGLAMRSAGNHLSQAVWWYNRELPQSR